MPQNIDVTTMSESDLASLRDQVQDEISARSILASAQAAQDGFATQYRRAADRAVPKGQTPAWAPGGMYPVGYQVTYGGKTYKVIQTHTAQADWAPDKVPALFNVVAPPAPAGGGAAAWTAGVAYKAGNQVTYQGKTYKAIQSHTAQTGWEPPAVAALWATA